MTPEWFAERVGRADRRTSTTTAIARCTSRRATRCWRRCAITCTARRGSRAERLGRRARHRSRPGSGSLPPVRRPAAGRRWRLAAVLPKPPFACDLTPRARAGGVRAAEAAAWRGLGRCSTANEDQPSTSVVVPSLTLDPRSCTKLAGASLLRGAAAVPADPAAQPARARGLRDLAAGAPADPRLLPASARRRAREPRARAADDALRVRRLAAAADAEDPRAAAPAAAHPLRHPGPRARVPDRLQLDAARAPAVGAARHPAERPRSRRCRISAPSRAAAGCSARRASTCPAGFEDLQHARRRRARARGAEGAAARHPAGA